MATVGVAATQMACSWDTEANVQRAIELVREAASRGAQHCAAAGALRDTLLLHRAEAASTSGWRQPREGQRPACASVPEPWPGSSTVVLPISWFERAGNSFFNSCLRDRRRRHRCSAYYRKAHIPNCIGYQEKSYFTPGDTGFASGTRATQRIGVANLLGPVVPGGRALHGAARRGAAACTPPPSAPNPVRRELDSRWTLAAHDAGPRRGQRGAGASPPTASADEGRHHESRVAHRCSTATRSSATTPGRRRRSRPTIATQGVLVSHFDLDAIRRLPPPSGALFRDRRPELVRSDLLSSLAGHGLTCSRGHATGASRSSAASSLHPDPHRTRSSPACWSTTAALTAIARRG
jgi:N-carbamoylputrescine amidase